MQKSTKLRAAKSVIILSVVPFLIYAYEYGPDAGAAGVPGEPGSCNQSGCHTGTAVNGGGGSVTVTFPNGLTYTPGVKQHLIVTIDDSKQRRWGFELTARLGSDITQMAGTFSPTDSHTQLMCDNAGDLGVAAAEQNTNTACPAGLPLAYIEQTLAGYNAVQPNPGKYEFDWNPPATDVGPIKIYVAANAANGDLTQNGDHIYTANYTLTSAAGGQPPSITSAGVLNAASQAPPPLPNSAIAQGSIFVINGSNLGPAPPAQPSGYPLQTSLGGTSVQVTVNGTSLAAPIAAASANQVTAIMPSAMPPGTGTVTVSVNGQPSSAAPVQVAPADFGIYTLNGKGSGPAQAAHPNGTPVTLVSPAQPGETITLSGTGLGPISADDVSQPSMQDISPTVALYLGPEQVTPQYAGRSGNGPGQDQVTFTVPPDAITGCYVPVSVVLNKISSNFASIAVSADGSPCSDGNGLTSTQVQQIAAVGGNVKVASINLARTAASAGATVDNGSAVFGAYTTTQLASWLGPSQSASSGGCLVFAFNGSSPGVTDPTQPQGLDAGASLTVAGANGSDQLAPAGGAAGVYSGQGSSAGGGPLFLDPPFTLSGSGGANIGAFQVQPNASPAINWTSAAASGTVNRSQGLTVTWTGGDPNGYVYINGNSVALQTNSPAGAMFTCTAPAAAGTFTIPPAVTLALPASSTGTLGVTSLSAPLSFTAPGVDIGLVTTSSGVSQPAAFQ